MLMSELPQVSSCSQCHTCTDVQSIKMYSPVVPLLLQCAVLQAQVWALATPDLGSKVLQCYETHL